jgi:hypothetical protein
MVTKLREALIRNQVLEKSNVININTKASWVFFIILLF